MQEHEKSLYTLLVMGGIIALGKMLTTDEKITVRRAIGRMILGSALSVAAGAALIHFPDLSPLAINGLGSALGIAGYQVVEIWLKRYFHGKPGDKKS